MISNDFSAAILRGSKAHQIMNKEKPHEGARRASFIFLFRSSLRSGSCSGHSLRESPCREFPQAGDLRGKLLC